MTREQIEAAARDWLPTFRHSLNVAKAARMQGKASPFERYIESPDEQMIVVGSVTVNLFGIVSA